MILEQKRNLMISKNGGGILPSEYQQVEWIGTSGNGTEYIEVYPRNSVSPYTPFTADDYFEIGVSVTGATSQIQRIIGVSGYARGQINTSLEYGAYGYATSNYQQTTMIPDTKYDFDFIITRNFNLRYSPFLFGSNSIGEYNFYGKLYYLKHYNNNQLVKELVPCFRKNDGEIGMYDTLEKQFYTNSGTGTFTKGPEV